MNPTRLLSSSTFRLTLLYVFLFTLSGVAVFVAIYYRSAHFMQEQVIETIDAEVKGLKEQYRNWSYIGLVDTINRRSNNVADDDNIYQLTDPDGNLVAGNMRGEVGTDGWVEGYGSFVAPSPHNVEHHYVGWAAIMGDGSRILVGRDTENLHRLKEKLLTTMAFCLAAMFVIGTIGGILVSRWTLGRLERINHATQEIMDGDFGRRIETGGGGNEFDELARNLNAMLERIERLLEGMREVTNNVAHDLRTPLTRMRSRIEVALMQADHNDETREVLEGTVRDAEGLINTFNALLNIAKAEAGEQQSEWEGVDLAELARDVAELYEPLAEERQITFSLDAASGVQATGNRHLIAQALANLVDNAIKYTPEGGRVTMQVQASPRPTIVVTDTGRGIPADLREKALERFVRLESDRSTPGSGLGLSLVNAVAKLHDATLVLGDNQPGLRVELAFRVRSPQASPTPVRTAMSPA